MVCCLTAPSHHQVQSWPTGINNIYLCNTSQDMSLGLNELNYVMFLFKVKSQLIICWWKGNDIDKQNKHECFILCNREFLSFNIRPYCRHACVKEIFYFVKEISVFSCSCYWSPPSQVGSPVVTVYKVINHNLNLGKKIKNIGCAHLKNNYKFGQFTIIAWALENSLGEEPRPLKEKKCVVRALFMFICRMRSWRN